MLRQDQHDWRGNVEDQSWPTAEPPPPQFVKNHTGATLRPSLRRRRGVEGGLRAGFAAFVVMASEARPSAAVYRWLFRLGFVACFTDAIASSDDIGFPHLSSVAGDSDVIPSRPGGIGISPL